MSAIHDAYNIVAYRYLEVKFFILNTVNTFLIIVTSIVKHHLNSDLALKLFDRQLNN